MSRIDDLIKELCPEGVEYKTLQDVYNLTSKYSDKKFYTYKRHIINNIFFFFLLK